MTELSAAAQAVLAAVTQSQYGLEPEDVPNEAARIACEAAAALRAAADQVDYHERLGWTGYGYYTEFQNQILAIAAELEGAQ